MGFGGRFRTEIIPERVYALLRFVNYKKRSKDELRSFLQPEDLNRRNDIFNKVYSFALDNKFIKKDLDGLIVCMVADDKLESHINFRKFMADKLLNKDEGSMFFKFTSWYLAQNDNFFEYSSSKQLQSRLKEGDLIKLREVDLLAWRFWAKFLGVGILHQSFVIPNTAIRIKDIIEEDDTLSREKKLAFSVFMDWLLERCPEFKEGIENNRLSFGVSLGLRNLHDQGKIKLEYLRDADEIWHLVRSDIHDIPEQLSQIEIKRW